MLNDPYHKIEGFFRWKAEVSQCCRVPFKKQYQKQKLTVFFFHQRFAYVTYFMFSVALVLQTHYSWYVYVFKNI